MKIVPKLLWIRKLTREKFSQFLQLKPLLTLVPVSQLVEFLRNVRKMN